MAYAWCVCVGGCLWGMRGVDTLAAVGASASAIALQIVVASNDSRLL